jgi:hypothetical protein
MFEGRTHNGFIVVSVVYIEYSAWYFIISDPFLMSRKYRWVCVYVSQMLLCEVTIEDKRIKYDRIFLFRDKNTNILGVGIEDQQTKYRPELSNIRSYPNVNESGVISIQ